MLPEVPQQVLDHDIKDLEENVTQESPEEKNQPVEPEASEYTQITKAEYTELLLFK